MTVWAPYLTIFRKILSLRFAICWISDLMLKAVLGFVAVSISCRGTDAPSRQTEVPNLEDMTPARGDKPAKTPGNPAVESPAPPPSTPVENPAPITGEPPSVGAPSPDSGVARERSDAAAPPAPPAIATVPCKIARLCDDFEAYPVGGKPGGIWTAPSGSTLLVDSTRAFSGTKSIAIKLPATANAQAFMTPSAKGLFPLKDNNLFGRMMVYLPKTPGPGDRHWDMVIASGPIAGGGRGNYMFGGYTEKFWPSYQPHHCWKDSKSPFTVGKWVCMQWQFDGSKATADTTRNQLTFSIDGVPHPDITVDRFGSGCTTGKWEWLAPAFDSIRFGYVQYQASTAPVEVWIDDVAVSDAPIACPTKP